jgi:hypothetical protein
MPPSSRSRSTRRLVEVSTTAAASPPTSPEGAKRHGARVRAHRAARRRQVRRRWLQGLRRPARRRRLGGQRAVLSAPRSPGDQQVRPEEEPAQGEGRQPHRRGHPRGHHRDHLGEAARAAVRGPDQGQARQRPMRKGSCRRRPTSASPSGSRSTPPRPTRSCKKALSGRAARVAARNARNATRRKSALDGAGMPDKLKDCSAATRGVRALHRRGRLGRWLGQGRPRPAHQAILPIRGKILNVERARIDKMLKNTEVQALITAIGGGVGEEFDVDQGPLPQGRHPV